MIKKVSQSVRDYLGSWAYFVGSIMADGFHDRMSELEDEDNAAIELSEAKKVEHGTN